jgi:biopolymer transport protein ExbB
MEFIKQTIDLFHKGGPVMYLLVACSIFVVTIAIERFMYYRKVHTNNHVFRNKLQASLDKHNLTEAIQFCQQSPAALAQVAVAGLQASHRGAHVDIAVESAASLAAANLREHLDDLSTVVTLAPLLGLLGTVIGMIGSFSVFNVQSGQPMAITGGVGEALIATATGLSVATLALLTHSYFSRRVNKFVTEIEQVSALVLGYMPAKKAARRDTHEIA